MIAQLDIDDRARALATLQQFNAAQRMPSGQAATAAADNSAGTDIDEGYESANLAPGGAGRTSTPDVLKSFDPTRLDGLATRGLDIDKSNWALPLDTPPYVAYSAVPSTSRPRVRLPRQVSVWLERAARRVSQLRRRRPRLG